MGKKDKNKAFEAKKGRARVTSQTISYLPEREWFIKKFESEVGKRELEMVSLQKLEKSIKSRKKCAIEKHLYHSYQEVPEADNIKDIVWDGPPLISCFCLSPLDNCNCKVNMVLPPRMLPIGIYWKFLLMVHKVLQMKCLKFIDLTLPKPPKKPFVKRFQEHLEVEAAVATKLKKMNFECGPEFCVLRRYNYYQPYAEASSRYYKKKKQLYSEYKDRHVPIKKAPPPPPPSVIADETMNDDGMYRTTFTQETFDENGNFVMGEGSPILFGNSSVYQDIEGTPYNVNSYHEVESEKPESMVKKLEKLLSISGIKKRVSKLTSNLMSSIVEIEDTGIPINTRATQDPPLDNSFESIKMSSKYKVVKVTKKELCPCCNKYKELQTVPTDQVESNVIDNYDEFESTVVDSTFNAPFDKRHLGFSDNIHKNNVGKQILPQKTTTTKCDDNVSKVRNINENIELLKRDLMTNKQVKKYKSVDRNKDLFAIKSKFMLNKEEEENKIDQKTTKDAPGVLKKNDQLNSLEFLESIKPCCIDNLFKRLETKITNERFVTKLLELEMLRKLGRCIKKIETEKEIQNSNPIDSTNARLEILKLIKSLKSSINITIKKFSAFIKKQTSSLKSFTKKMKDAHMKAQRRNAVSLEDFKIKMKKSFKKMNYAVSSFCKRHYKKSSNNLKQFMSSFKKSMSKSVKANSSEDGDSKVAEHPCNRQCNTPKNMPDKQDSNTSEKEVFSMQYNSTF